MPGVAEKVRVILEWLPAINMIPAIAAADEGQARAVAACEFVEFIATKTETPMDDELASLCKAILLTPEGGALVDYIAAKLRSDDDDKS